jgi:hypothetical protein
MMQQIRFWHDAETRANLLMRTSMGVSFCLWLLLAVWLHSWLVGALGLLLGPAMGFLVGEQLVARLTPIKRHESALRSGGRSNLP